MKRPPESSAVYFNLKKPYYGGIGIDIEMKRRDKQLAEHGDPNKIWNKATSPRTRPFVPKTHVVGYNPKARKARIKLAPVSILETKDDA